MTLPKIIPLKLSTANPCVINEYNFKVELAQKTGTNGPRDLFSAYTVDFFEKYTAAFAKTVQSDVLIGYDGSRAHQSISISAREYLRRCGISIKELDYPVTVPEFMYACYKLGLPGCFFGRSHSPEEYIGLKLVINGGHIIDLFKKMGVNLDHSSNLKLNEIYGFLPRTLAPVVEKAITEDRMVDPRNMGKFEIIEAAQMREKYFSCLKKIIPLKKIIGNYIVDCRHSMAGEVWKLIKAESNAQIALDNALLNPVAPDRDPREIWDQLVKKYYTKKSAVFSHDADADRTFLLKIPGLGKEKIVYNQEESFTTGLLAEAQEKVADAYILVQERISLIMLNSLKQLVEKVYATAQGEPAFFLGLIELMLKNPNLTRVSGADYSDIFFSKTLPVCMKSPYHQALWLMYWFTGNEKLPAFPAVDTVQTQIDMLNLDYPQRLQKVLASSEKILKYLEEKYQIIYHSTLDGQNVILKDAKENLLILSIRPSGTGRYTKVFSEIGMGKSTKTERKAIAEGVNKTIEKIINE